METLEEQLIRMEDDEQYAYDDTTGKKLNSGDRLIGNLSIGIGHNLSATGLSEYIRNLIFNDDLDSSDTDLYKIFPWIQNIDEVRKDVFRNMCFNMGIKRLSAFSATLGAAQRNKFDEAASHLRDSLAYKELPTRYEELAIQLETGQRQK
jgi:lysozyme